MAQIKTAVVDRSRRRIDAPLKRGVSFLREAVSTAMLKIAA
jgi:hypothetical protein